MAGRSYVVVDRHEAPGLYRVERDDGRTPEHFTVRGEMVEGDLRTLRGDASARLEQTLGARLYDGWDEAVEALGPADALSEAWPAILALMLSVYVFEAWFVRKTQRVSPSIWWITWRSSASIASGVISSNVPASHCWWRSVPGTSISVSIAR